MDLHLLKHMTGLSNAEVLLAVRENPHMQAFCGFEHFVTANILEVKPFSPIRGKDL